MNIGDLKTTAGADNMGGTKLIAYLARLEDILSMPDYKSSPASMADEATVDQNIVMQAGKRFYEIEAEPLSGNVVDSKVEGAGNGYESTYEFMFPEESPAALGFAKVAPTTNWVAVVIDNDGQRRLMGIKTPARIAAVDGTTGKANENVKGVTFQIKSYQNGPAPVYEGTIDNDSGSGSGI